MEETFIERIRAGDDRAIADLASAYSGKIFRMAFRHLRSREDAEEVVQDVLLTITRKSASFRGDAALSSWIYRIAFNSTMTRLRRRRTGHAWQRREADGRARVVRGTRELVDRSAGPDTRVYRAQLRRRLRLALLELPAHYRAPVVLRDLRGLSTAQAGAALSVTRQTLKSRLHRGRVMLRHRLADLAGEVVSRKRRAEALTNQGGALPHTGVPNAFASCRNPTNYADALGAPHLGSVACGAPTPRAAPSHPNAQNTRVGGPGSQARCARLVRYAARRNEDEIPVASRITD